MVDIREPHRALYSERIATASAQHGHTNGPAEFVPVVDTGSTLDSAAVLVEPWLLTENDLQWLISLGKKKYGSSYDYLTVEGWFRNIVLKAPLMFLPIRLANSFLIAMLATTPWAPSAFECNIVFICADDGFMWEAAKLLRHSIEWARKRKCTAWRLTSDTRFDLAPIARRLGATEISPRFSVIFQEHS